MSRLSRELDVAIAAADEAAAAIMGIYATEFSVEFKEGDDPVTIADRQANAHIVQRLADAFPGDAIVAEESANESSAMRAHRCWYVDPLDGTREFVARNGEFCVMIGLAIDGRAAAGVIAIPAWKSAPMLLAGVVGEGAFLRDASGARRPLTVASGGDVAGARIVVSRSRFAPALAASLGSAGAQLYPLGSGGVKAAAVLLGEADAYVHPKSGPDVPGPSKWDLCAPEAIIRAAGGMYTDGEGAPFHYEAGGFSASRGQVIAGNHLHAALLRAIG